MPYGNRGSQTGTLIPESLRYAMCPPGALSPSELPLAAQEASWGSSVSVLVKATVFEKLRRSCDLAQGAARKGAPVRLLLAFETS
eukprot:scaffold7366_cov254-Pinguiococcus_pyrenoidosus.AAC.2